ncbi:hypothetical protein QYE76_039689 [Lolium multiflorum]|uniref:RNase H type-1 domain-containing protein n=1 Tax=Lolium multiflorum TaxID=4521 RepID=A0AAD8WU79_LOLMU|nr:hypothetical protein QYE76_039689 [Lolium multiflorum]
MASIVTPRQQLAPTVGDHLRYVLQIHFRASNNVAEYEALVHGLKVAKEIGVHRIICYGDSDLVVQQCSGDWDAKDANMAAYRFYVQKIAGFFEGREFHHVPRAENEAADTLSKLGSSREEIPPGIALAHLRTPSIKPSSESESIFVPGSHIVPMDIDGGNQGTAATNPGTSGSKSEETMVVDHMEIDVPVFLMKLNQGGFREDPKPIPSSMGEMYKRSITGVLQRCVEPEEGKEMLLEDLKDVQKFTGTLASLSRFTSRLGEKALPLFALMKKSDTFVWTPQTDATFKELKKMLATTPVLASPLEREPMLLYIAATNRVMSIVVVVEREEEGKTVQCPVYYLREVLSLPKQNYPHFQKMTYGVFMASIKLKHYFEEHPMKVVSEAPISDIICNKDASSRIAKWAIQLSPYVPVYERRDAIKSQALADFLVDWAEMQYKPPKPEKGYRKMHFDGSKLKEGLGAGVVLTSPKGDHLRYVLQIHFNASNNVAEYEALVHGLKFAKEIGVHRIIFYGDSDLVV